MSAEHNWMNGPIEIELAANAITTILFGKSNKTETELERFKNILINVFHSKFKNHWYESDPLKGAAYRSVVYRAPLVDGTLEEACKKIGWSVDDIECEEGMTVWIDPYPSGVQIQFDTDGLVQRIRPCDNDNLPTYGMKRNVSSNSLSNASRRGSASSNESFTRPKCSQYNEEQDEAAETDNDMEYMIREMVNKVISPSTTSIDYDEEDECFRQQRLFPQTCQNTDNFQADLGSDPVLTAQDYKKSGQNSKTTRQQSDLNSRQQPVMTSSTRNFMQTMATPIAFQPIMLAPVGLQNGRHNLQIQQFQQFMLPRQIRNTPRTPFIIPTGYRSANGQYICHLVLPTYN